MPQGSDPIEHLRQVATEASRAVLDEMNVLPAMVPGPTPPTTKLLAVAEAAGVEASVREALVSAVVQLGPPPPPPPVTTVAEAPGEGLNLAFEAAERVLEHARCLDAALSEVLCLSDFDEAALVLAIQAERRARGAIEMFLACVPIRVLTAMEFSLRDSSGRAADAVLASALSIRSGRAGRHHLRVGLAMERDRLGRIDYDRLLGRTRADYGHGVRLEGLRDLARLQRSDRLRLGLTPKGRRSKRLPEEERTQLNASAQSAHDVEIAADFHVENVLLESIDRTRRLDRLVEEAHFTDVQHRLAALTPIRHYAAA